MLRKHGGTAARSASRQHLLEARYERALDRLEAAYIDWRETSDASREAYGQCDTSPWHEAGQAFVVYFAALDREERAAAEYAACVERVCALLCRHGAVLGAGPWPALDPHRALLRRPNERL